MQGTNMEGVYNAVLKRICQKAEDMTFFLPAMAIYLIVVIFPVFYGFYFSMTDWNGIRQVFNFIGFQNYIEALKDPKLYNALVNILCFTLVYTILHSVLGLFIAKIFIKNSKLNNACKVGVFVPFVISVLCISYIWNYIYTPINGILNNGLISLGVISKPVNWLGDEKLALWSCVLTMLWYALGFTFVIYIAGLKGIPVTYYEAAEIDGANGWKRFTKIDMPLLMPVTTVVLVVDVITSFKLFDIFFVMTKGGPGYATDTITTMIFREAFTNRRMAYSTTISVILFIIVLLTTCLQLYMTKKIGGEGEA